MDLRRDYIQEPGPIDPWTDRLLTFESIMARFVLSSPRNANTLRARGSCKPIETFKPCNSRKKQLNLCMFS